MTTTYKGWYLLDHHKNRTRPEGGMAGDPRTKPWYASRRTCQHGYDRPHLIVIHTPETIEDFTPPYDEAERVAKYGAQTTRASWHDTIDADSIIPMLPPTYTAWHVRGFNRCAIGMEIGAKATSWKRAPAAWVEGVVENAAYRAAQHAKRFGIPARLLFAPGKRYSSAINPSGVGFVSHHALDPGRRTDPGFDFPWNGLMARVRAHLDEKEGDDVEKVSKPDWLAWSEIDNLVSAGILTKRPDKEPLVKWEMIALLARLWGRVQHPSGGVDSLARGEIERIKRHLRAV